MRFALFIFAASLSWGACSTDANGWCITGLSAAQNSLLGPLIPFGASPWTYGDAAEKAVADNMAPAALAEVPVLGAALSGTVSWTAGTNTITTTADQTAALSPGDYIALAWNSVDGAGTGRQIQAVSSVTATTITTQTNIFAPTSSGITAYHMSSVPDSHGWTFLAWTQGVPSVTWNYYDVAIAFYRLYYRTGNVQYQTWARQYADITWQWTLDHGYTYIFPRGMSMISQFFRALDGHPERFPGLYLLSQQAMTSYGQFVQFCPYCDNRESGYALWWMALGAKTDTDATRHAAYCTSLTTYTPFWNSVQQSDGSFGENDYALNTSFVSAVKSFTPPFIYQGSPWREAINIKSLEAAYEVLNDTSAQGCNSTALAATTLTTITNAVTWQNNYGRDTVNRGVYYEVNSQSADQETVNGAGTVSVSLTSTAVTGVGTNWQTAGYCDGTHFIGIASPNDPRTVYKIASCADNTHLTLSNAFGLFGETMNVSGSAYGVAPAAHTPCNSSATYCYGSAGDRNLTRTVCGGIGWLYNQTLNPTYKSWTDECVSAQLGGPTAGLTSADNIGAATLPCSGPACDGWVTDTVTSAPSCIDTMNAPPCVYGGVMYSNLGKNYGEAFGAPGIDNALAWRLTPGPPAPTAPSITSVSPLPGGTVGTAYSYQFTATGTAPITWTGTGLPAWASLSSSGLLSGTPNTAAASSLAITATNLAGSNGPLTFSLTVVTAGVAPTITSTSPLPGGTTLTPYSYQFTANGSTPITWSATGLPGWASLSSAGLLTGLPNVGGTSTIQATATNGSGSAGPTSFSLTITSALPAATCSPKTGVSPPTATDIQLQTAMMLGTVACTNSLTGSGCTVVDVQRVINAALGGACVTGP